MAQFCCDMCKYIGSICDFCKFYNFNGDKNGVYNGRGYCEKFKVYKEPEQGVGCEEYICKLIKG